MSEEATLDDFGKAETKGDNEKKRITGFGTFPPEWGKKDITECAKIRDSERIPLNSKERDEKKPGDIPYYGANGVLDYINEYIFDSELILLAEDGGHFEEYQDRPIAYRISGKAWVNNHAHILEASDDTETDYLFYSLEHRNLVPYVSGSTRSKLTQSMLKKVKIPSPPLSEQRKIGTVLYTVDQAIEKTEEIKQKVKRVRNGVRQDIFSRGIRESGTERADGELKETYLGTVPEDWQLHRVDDVCTHVVDCPHSTPEYSEQGTPVVRTSEIEDGRYYSAESPRVDEEGYQKRTSRLEPKPGDVVFTREAPIGEAFKIPEGMKLCLGQRLMQLRPKESVLNADFLVELLYSDIMQSWFERSARGSTSTHVNVGDIEKLKIPVPSIEEQYRIVDVLSGFREQLESEQNLLSRFQRLKRGLMQDLLSGTVRTTNTNIEGPEEIARYG